MNPDILQYGAMRFISGSQAGGWKSEGRGVLQQNTKLQIADHVHT